MLIGYARVSTNEQNLDLQRDALLKAGVAAKDIFTDKVTGVKSERPGLAQSLSHLREGDTFIVWRLDRLGRSLKHLIETVTALKEQGVAFKSLTENIDTSTVSFRPACLLLHSSLPAYRATQLGSEGWTGLFVDLLALSCSL